MRNIENKYSGIFVRILLLAFVFSVFVFLCIYLLDMTNFPSKHGIVNDENSQTWLKLCVEYFGPVVGSFVGFAGTVFAVLIPIMKQNENRKEDSRKNVLPLIKVKDKVDVVLPARYLPGDVKGPGDGCFSSIIDVLGDGKTILQIKLFLKNVGQREMYDIWVGGIKCGSEENDGYCNIMPILYKGEEYMNCLSSAVFKHGNNKTVEITFRIYFKDCYDNWYYQGVDGKGHFYSNGYMIDRFTVNSAPILVEGKSLPTKILKQQASY